MLDIQNTFVAVVKQREPLLVNMLQNSACVVVKYITLLVVSNGL